MYINQIIVDKIINAFPFIPYSKTVPLSDYTSMKVGGITPLMMIPDTLSNLSELLFYLKNLHIPYFILGKGSNLIINDEYVDRVFISTKNLDQIYLNPEDETQIVAEAGANLVDLSAFALEYSLSGLEFSCGIPGTVGGAVFMNAGAYGAEIKNVLYCSEVFFEDQGRKIIFNPDHRFSYRYSVLSDNKGIILQSTFQLKKEDKDKIDQSIEEFTELRNSKQPLDMPSAGSIFKRPEGYFAGQLIQESGLQGYTIGGASVSEKHAGFIVNTGNATAHDILNLILYIQKVVKQKFGVWLEPEVKFLEKDGSLRTFT